MRISTEVGVHRSHCCALHGCKYSEPLCPVINRFVEQDAGVCEHCPDGEQVDQLIDLISDLWRNPRGVAGSFRDRLLDRWVEIADLVNGD